MIERTIDRFDAWPARLLGDTGYGSAEMLGWLVYEQGIEPHVTVFDKSPRTDGTFSRDHFTYDHEAISTTARRQDADQRHHVSTTAPRYATAPVNAIAQPAA